MAAWKLKMTRHYWHVDAKWITGLLLVFALGLTLLFYNLIHITEREQAVDTLSLVFAYSFSMEKGLDDESDLEELRKLLQASPNQKFQVPGLNLSLTLADIENKSGREVRMDLARQLAEPYYEQGVEGLTGLLAISESGSESEMLDSLKMWSFLTLDAHEKIQGYFKILLGISVFLATLLVLFSHRFGRLGSLGLAVSIASLPGVFLGGIVAESLQGTSAAAGAAGGFQELASSLGVEMLTPVLPTLKHTYVNMLIMGLGLLATAFVGSLIWRVVLKIKSRAISV